MSSLGIRASRTCIFASPLMSGSVGSLIFGAVRSVASISVLSLAAVLCLSACGDDSTSGPPATGACCSGDTCFLTTAADCGSGSLFMGEGVDCAPEPCAGFGACCVDGECRTTASETDCADLGGAFWGTGQACPPSLSELPPDSGPNKGGALVLHCTPDISTTRDGVVDVNSCEDVVVSVPGDDSAVVLYLFAVFPDEVSPEVTGVQFGITYTTEVASSGRDANVVFELPTTDWPSSGSGVALTVTEHDPIRSHMFPVYWFLAYAYDGSSFEIGRHPYFGRPAFYDASIPSVADSVWALGKVGFGSAEGRRPCSPCE